VIEFAFKTQSVEEVGQVDILAPISVLLSLLPIISSA